MTSASRFWAKVRKTRTCWLWTAGTNGQGYGQFRFEGRAWQAHVWAWVQEHGPVPAGLELDHLCRRPLCVRPSHLEAVTHAVNIRRGFIGRPKKRACPVGHRYTKENTLVNRRGYWECRECRRLYNQAYRQRIRGYR